MELAAVTHLARGKNPTGRGELLIIAISFMVWSSVFVGQAFGYVDPNDLPKMWGALGYLIFMAIGHAVGVEYEALRNQD